MYQKQIAREACGHRLNISTIQVDRIIAYVDIYLLGSVQKNWEPRATKVLVNNVVVQAKGEERIKVVQVRDLPKRSQASECQCGPVARYDPKRTPWSLVFHGVSHVRLHGRELGSSAT